MSFLKSLGNLVQATIDVAVTPLDVVRDVVDYANGDEADHLASRLKKAKDNLGDAYDELGED